MLQGAARALRSEAPAAPAPDREGRIRGLSLSGFHEVAYVDWGPREDEIPVICVHGLTRQGRDFDHLAVHLATRGRRVVCPDLPGRGRSGRLRDPNEYALPQYCADMNALIARLGALEVDFIGTSLGGLIGMVLAGQPGSPIRRLVVNDIGPYLPWSGLARLGRYVGSMPAGFATFEDAEAYFREVLAPFGALDDAQWQHLSRHSVAWDPAEEHFALLCDREIVRAFRNPWHYSLDVWRYWKTIAAPVLVLRGVDSDLLPADLAREMGRRNPRTLLHEIAGCGHAPPLMAADQIEVVTHFLEAPMVRV
jgi:pimeloyl-ACP methyl ester carboxylesterase